MSELINAPITRVFVIRRKLGGVARAGLVAHSALLLWISLCGSTAKFVLEYMDDGEVYLEQVDTTNTIKIDQENIRISNNNWTKQKIGKKPPGVWTPAAAKREMEKHTTKKQYSLTSHNCHMAQEATRRGMGCF